MVCIDRKYKPTVGHASFHKNYFPEVPRSLQKLYDRSEEV